MEVLEEIAAFLGAAGLGLTGGSNLFANYLPDVGEQGVAAGPTVALFEYQGEAPEDTFGTALPAWEYPRVQVLIRADTVAAARDLAVAVAHALHAVTNQTLSGALYMRIQMLQRPFFLQRDDHGPTRNVVYACNFRCHRVPS